MNRRDLLKALGFTGIATAAGQLKGFSETSLNIKSGYKPIALGTWHNQGVQSNVEAWKILSSSGSAIDAVEAAAVFTENDWNNCCVGLGGNPDRDGIVTLDACIMNHENQCGSVMGLERIKHPIQVARRMMEKTPHVILVGDGAQQFALSEGFPLEPTGLSDHADKSYQNWLKKSEYKPQINIEKQEHKPEGTNTNHDTFGIIALDAQGNLSGACTTSGMAFKMHGRVGDSPVIGAGLYVDNEVGAATCSGLGEEVVRACGSFMVVEYMRQGLHPSEACKKAVERIVKKSKLKPADYQVGFIAINKQGEYGGYSINKGFDFTASYGDGKGEKVDAKSLF